VPPAALIIGLLALVSLPLVLAGDDRRDRTDYEMWLFANRHQDLYGPILKDWNEANPDATVRSTLIGMEAVGRRTMDGFLAEVPTADLIEVEIRLIGPLFAGPLDSVGFVDLTDRLKAEGLDETINPKSFAPWTKDGRIFGLPHDVHPVMLGYRADVFEQAGIDIESLTTWDKFQDALLPILDTDGDGTNDRWAIAWWPTEPHMINVLLLQSGVPMFDDTGLAALANESYARVIARLVTWMTGPKRIAAEVREFTAGGNQLMSEGFALSGLCPDWMCNVWKNDITPLAGKVKLMPMPAWEEGGLRTSVRGGTMLGIAKAAENQDELWEFAKHLYLDEDLARTLYTEGDIITPIRSMWDDPVFDEPDPFFMNQRKGRMYIDLADEIPTRTSSPYTQMALARVQDALFALRREADEAEKYSLEFLEPRAMELLEAAQDQVNARIERNAFIARGPAGAAR